MKRHVIVGLLALVGLVGAGAAFAYFRPDLVPEWARLGPAPAAAPDSGLYCNEHGVPEKFCTLCHEELKQTLMLCKEHGDIPEDICTLCHPEMKEKHNIVVCKEHELPEAFCYLCGKGPSASLYTPDDGWCVTHNKPESLCEECLKDPNSHIAENQKECRQPLPLVRLATPQLADKLGLQFATASAETHTHTLEANAETAFDANRHAEVTPRVTGFLREARVDLGSEVKAGQVIAVVDSAEVSAAKSRHIASQATLNLARVSYQRTQALAKRDAVPAKDELDALTTFHQAESAALDASQVLRNLGFTDTDLARIITDKDTTSQLSVVAPIDGTIIERHAVRNEPVQAITQLFAIADTSKMWVWIDVYEADILKIKPGQSVSFSLTSGDPDEGYKALGQVTWLGAEVDETTRTTRVRAEIANLKARLRANQFGTAVIQIGEPHEIVVVPKAAVQTKDNTEVVFLPEGQGVFRPQRIMTQPSARKDVVEVAWGLKPGDKVVTRGSFWLKTEIMKGAIGAGCCD
jgi:cobalt-zinc-cadmium efflux system membrane fusion protein